MRHAIVLLAAVALTGCNRKEITAPPSKPPNDNLTGAQRVTGAVPILRRTIGQNDLNQLKTFLINAHAETGKYPKALSDIAGLERDAPNLAKYIKDGDLVLAGGKGGVLAYEKAAMEEKGSVVTTTGIAVMTKDELEKALGN